MLIYYLSIRVISIENNNKYITKVHNKLNVRRKL